MLNISPPFLLLWSLNLSIMQMCNFRSPANPSLHITYVSEWLDRCKKIEKEYATFQNQWRVNNVLCYYYHPPLEHSCTTLTLVSIMARLWRAVCWTVWFSLITPQEHDLLLHLFHLLGFHTHHTLYVSCHVKSVDRFFTSALSNYYKVIQIIVQIF